MFRAHGDVHCSDLDMPLCSGTKPFVDATNSVRLIEIPAVDRERIANALVKEDLTQSQKILGMGFKIGVD